MVTLKEEMRATYIGLRVERMEVRGRKGQSRPKKKVEVFCESRLE
jgi:hypothetical protein